MKIAVEGCCHGELDKIYETLEYIEKKNSIKINLLLICGDFQAVRNVSDLQCMAVPQHYQKLNTFYKYYSGEKKAPYLTVFIGGNHEASNYLQELPYGGWVAPNIYYMGYAGVIQFAGIRIGGLSGIFKGRDYNKGHFEHVPYDNETKRTVYHVRSFDVFRLKQISRPVDIFLSHDWPRGIYNFGNVNMLLKKKQYFREEVEQDRLGSPASKDLLYHLKPEYWFAAHLHVKFPAIVQHQEVDGNQKQTKFLSLDKCLPRRKFLQILDIPHDVEKPMKIELDPEWLAILKSTNHLLNLTKMVRYMPGPGSNEKWDFTVTKEDINQILEDFGGDLSLPENFEKTAPVHNPNEPKKKSPPLVTNPQTTLLCTMLDLTDPNAVFLGKDSHIKLETLSVLESAGETESEATEGDDEGDDVEDDDTEYESEPSFISVSGSERSFLSSSNADESFISGCLNLSTDDQNASFNPDEISISDEEDEFSEIMSAQKEAQKSDSSDEKLASPLKHVNIDSESSSLNTSLRSSEDEKSSPVKSVFSDRKTVLMSRSLVGTESDIDDADPELLEMMAAQKKLQASTSQSGAHLELAVPNSDEELEEILREQKSFKQQEGSVKESSPKPTQDESKGDTDKSSQKRNEGTECEESPQSKRLKRRNQQLYTDCDS
ncbi:lariat debranching enzyme A-like [Saccostrea cucullata]|uniref:lariat debranching enzyme A-like n=1 Tax=Saccostrea cuccullata TaxID=36930 RepID=UPI002ED28B25